MESINTALKSTRSSESPSFEVGDTVIYSTHGRCTVEAVEVRNIAGQSAHFYKLEKVKSPLSRSKKQEAAIWIPVASATSKGLRPVADSPNAKEALEILASREFYFPLDLSWAETQKLLETSICNEGLPGLAKAISFINVLRSRKLVLAPEQTRFYEMIHRAFTREVSEVLQLSLRQIDQLIEKGLKNKLRPDN